ncbi:MAG: phospholipase D-like domain-containing protein, partial [Betaproteobacteria bacterium]
YFRSKQIQALLLQRRKEVPKLQVIVVLPIAPEEFKEGDTNPMVLQPMALQNEIIRALTAELGADIGFFSLVARVASRKKSLTHEFGSPQIYVHSKVCIVDDVFATIGSANANGRSFALDTELNVSWVDPALKVRAFRIDLWSELLGLPASEIAAWTPDLFTANWRRIARVNATKSPARRSGFAIEHDHQKFDRIVGSITLPEALEAFLAISDLSQRPAPPELFSRDTAPERIEPIASAPSVS